MSDSFEDDLLRAMLEPINDDDTATGCFTHEEEGRMTETTEDSELVRHAMYELDLLGMTEDSEDIDKLGREGVLELVRMFSQQGHSGSSAAWMIGAVERLLRYEPLSPLTDDPDEWMHIAEEMAGEPSLYQSRRDPRAFSYDGGKTYYLVDEKIAAGHDLEVTPVYNTEPRQER